MRLGIKYLDGKRYEGRQCCSYTIKITKGEDTKVLIDFKLNGDKLESGFLELDQEACRWLAHALIAAADNKTENAQISTTLSEERKTKVTKVDLIPLRAI